MSKQRYINTHFWDDKYIQTLNPSEKLMFLYLLTNPLTNIAGIYEITMRRMIFDTGFNEDTVNLILGKFDADEKIYYIDGWIAICNFLKNQKLNPNMYTAAEKIRSTVPDQIIERLSKPSKAFEKGHSYSSSYSSSNSMQKTTKKEYASSVHLTESEYGKLGEKYGEINRKRMIEKLSNAKGAKGYRYKSDYKAILNWVVDALEIKPGVPVYRKPAETPTDAEREEAEKAATNLVGQIRGKKT